MTSLTNKELIRWELTEWESDLRNVDMRKLGGIETYGRHNDRIKKIPGLVRDSYLNQAFGYWSGN